MKPIIALLCLCVLSACAPIRVNYDYERTTDFSTFKTYNYYADMNTGLSGLDTNRLLDAFDAAMKSKGYTLAENPDFFVDINSSDYQEPSRSNVGVGMGGTGRNVGGGISVGIPIGQNTYSRQIVFEFVQEEGIGLFWQAVSESNYSPDASPEKREALFRNIVSKVLEDFPPDRKP